MMCVIFVHVPALRLLMFRRQPSPTPAFATTAPSQTAQPTSKPCPTSSARPPTHNVLQTTPATRLARQTAQPPSNVEQKTRQPWRPWPAFPPQRPPLRPPPAPRLHLTLPPPPSLLALLPSPTQLWPQSSNN